MSWGIIIWYAVVLIVVGIGCVILNDYRMYQNLQKRLKKERERKKISR